MKITGKYLYDLLPAYYRLLDSEGGEPLKALVEVLAREAGIVEEDIAHLYENWFIETCDEWVVPYIGDLLGVRGVHEINDKAVYSRRAYVANTLSYRRRKGTAPVLEQLALDITGWRTRVVEFFQLLSTSQHLQHIRLHSTATPDLRRMNQLDLLNTAFDRLSHTADVGRIAAGLGKYNIPNIGLYIWRLQSYPLNRADARKIAEGCYTFSPLGLDTHLFNQPQTEKDIVHLAEEVNVPGPWRRRVLHDELEGRRQAKVDEVSPEYEFFNDSPAAKYPPVFQLILNGNTTPIPPEEITICNLSSWQLPPGSKPYKKQGASPPVNQPITAAVDPVLGRITISDPTAVTQLQVSYSYGFSGDVGGGPYDREASLTDLQDRKIDWHVGVSKDHTPVAGEAIYPTLWEAIDEWHRLSVEKVGLITIMDNRSYQEELTGLHKILIPEGKQLFIIAADWPAIPVPGGMPDEKHRKPGMFNPEDLRPHIRGNIEVLGTAPADSLDGGELVLNGLLIEGKMTVLDGNLSSCVISHCTLVPEKGGFEAEHQAKILKVSMRRSICGAVKVSSEDAVMSIHECIIDHKEGLAVKADKSHLDIQKSTLFGRIEAQSLEAGNSTFNDLLTITRRQTGCVRFSYLPLSDDLKTPRRFRCQPELEIKTKTKEKLEKALAEQPALTNTEKEALRTAVRNQVLSWLFPVFNASTYGHHAYGQLGAATPREITTGAENASEMGVFNFLQQPQREANLRIALDEYLRLGLEAGIIFVT